MSDEANIRLERIEKLLRQLEYEVVRGMMEGEIDETMGFRFYVPISKKIPDGVVHCQFETRPIHRYQMFHDDLTPRLKLVKSS